MSLTWSCLIWRHPSKLRETSLLVTNHCYTWTPPNKTSEVSTEHFQTIIRKCPSRVHNGFDTSEHLFGWVPTVVDTSKLLFGSVLCIQIYSGCLAQIYTVFLKCIMFIAKYLIVKNICILYLLSW